MAAQSPAPVPPIAYRAPTLLIVRPSPDGSVPQNRPVIVLRLAAGEPTDPLDASSLRVWVDGVDRSALFQANGSDAWGPLAPPATADAALLVRRDSAVGASSIAGRPPVPGVPPGIAPGVHLVSAQLCSVRGVCGSLHAPVLVMPPNDAMALPAVNGAAMSAPTPPATTAAAFDHRSLGHRLIDAVAGGLKAILSP